MQLKIVKNEDKILLMHSDEVIETYSLTDSIDFSKFISILLDSDLKEAVSFDEIEFEPSQQEEALIKVLNFIKDNYNKKVEEYDTFLSDYLTKKSG